MTTRPLDLSQLSRTKRALLQRAVRLDLAGRDETAVPPRQGPVPLTPFQRGVWLTAALAPDRAALVMWESLRLRGWLDPDALSGALQALVERHEILRSAIRLVGDVPCQDAIPGFRLDVVRADLSDRPEGERHADARRLVSSLVAPFDLETGPLIRASILRLGADDHVFALTCHHVVADGVSMSLMIDELAELYNARIADRPANLRPVTWQFADLARWEDQHRDPERQAAHLAETAAYLADAPVELSLPLDRPRPERRGHRGADLRLVVPASTIEALTALARAEGATLFMALVAGIQALLGRLSGADAVLVAFPSSRRERREQVAMVGPLVNTLVLRGDLQGRPSFRTLLRRTRDSALYALARPDVPFAELAERLDPGRHAERAPLCQVMCSVLEAASAAVFVGLATGPFEIETVDVEVDLMFDLVGRPGGAMEVIVRYATEIFDRATVRRVADRLCDLLRNAVVAPDHRLEALLRASNEDEAVLRRINDTRRPYAMDRTVFEQFADMVARQPDAPAVLDDGERLTYRELHVRAMRLAGQLAAAGVGREDCVALVLPRSADLVATMLGTLALGAAYLPLDPSNPEPRLAFMVEDARAVAVVSSRACGFAPALPRIDPRAVDAAPTPPVCPAGGDGLACILYTSGSTGAPKGVALVHRGITRMATSLPYAMFEPTDRVVLGSNPSFDAATLEIYGALLGGASLVVASDEVLLDGARFYRWAREQRVSTIIITTALFHQIVRDRPDAFSELRHVMVAGEAQVPRWCRQPLESGWRGTLINGYGPAEGTTITTAYTIASVAPGQRAIPIGQPVANCRGYVLSEDLDPVPIGMVGELWIAGDGLARGYVRRPGLTAERFVPDPFSPVPGGRLYRTGDLVRLMPEGGFEFLGRRDSQIKLRGIRIELGEIEARLAACTGVAEAVAAVIGEPDDRRLIGYVVPVAGVSLEEASIVAELARHLPRSMIPALVVISALPRTSSGKLDRRSLPAPNRPPVRASSRPRTPLESIVASVFGHVLGIEAVGRDDDFFAIGGNSLRATEVAARLAAVCGVDLPYRTVFDHPTVADLALRVATVRQAAPPLRRPMARIDRAGRLPVSATQARLWFLDRLTPGQAAYNMPLATALRGPLDRAALAAALANLALRHEVLRTRYRLADGELEAVIDPPGSVALQAIALPTGNAGMDRTAVAARLAELAGRPFDLLRDWPLRAYLASGADDHVLLLVLHHIAFDGASVPVLLDELAVAYAAARGGRPIPLAAPAIQVVDAAAWQQQMADDPSLARELDHWQRRLAGPLPRLSLPADRPRSGIERGLAGVHRFALPGETVRALDLLAREIGATRFMAALAALAGWLRRVADQTDVLVGTPIVGREDAALDRVIGSFINTLALRIDVADRPSLRRLIARTREVALDAYDHASVPFERVVEAIEVERDLTRDPVFEVMFSLTEGHAPALSLEGLTSAPLEVMGGVARLDLELSIDVDGENWIGYLSYDCARFDAGTAERLARSFVRFLDAGLGAPDLAIERLPLLSSAEIAQALADAETPAHEPPASLVSMLDEAAVQRGPAIAVVDQGCSIRYDELTALSHAVAAHLRALRLDREARVVLVAERSIAAVAAILGALRAGVALVPFEPGLPEERVRRILADAAPGAVLVTRAGLAPTSFSGPVIDVAGLAREPAVERAAISPDQAATVLYTSGATGTPKGVVLTHRSLAGYVAAFRELTALGPNDRLLQFHALSFDASLEEILSALTAGACLVLRPPGPIESFTDFVSRLARDAVTVLDLPTAYWHEWMRHASRSGGPPASVRLLVVAGEAASLDAYRTWRSIAPPACTWINAYGPTEITCLATALVIPPGTALDDTPAIGRPIAGAKAYVLDDELHIVPVGVAGELHIGGPGVARGYLGSPALTAERFVPSPFHAGERLYRTGDRAVRSTDGVRFLGRLDSQVKLHGHRIELAEVEAALSAIAPLAQAVVVLRTDDGSPRLVAYVVPTLGRWVSPDELARGLARILPAAMRPAVYVLLEALPLTTSGKVDRRALPPPPLAAPAEQAPPASALERLLVEIWCDVLERDRVGAHDSFFAIGGHSLLATRVASRVHDLFGLEVPLRVLFEAPTVAELAAWLGREHGHAALDHAAGAVLEVAGIPWSGQGDRT